MEFEKSLYRVYEHAVSALKPVSIPRDERYRHHVQNVSQVPFVFKTIERCLLVLGVVVLCIFAILHREYVGSSECLRLALQEQHGFGKVPVAIVDGVAVQGDETQNDSGKSPKGIDEKYLYSEMMVDRIKLLQNISIGTEEELFGLQPVLFSDDIIRIRAFPREAKLSRSSASLWSNIIPLGGATDFAMAGDESELQVEQSSDDLQKPPNQAKDQFMADYEFSCNAPLLIMEKELREHHKVRSINVTLPRSCLGGGNVWKEFIVEILGVDTIVINQVMYAFKCDGVIQDTKSEEIWKWQTSDFESRAQGFFGNLLSKILISLKGVFSFFLVTAVTSVLVRVLISSGVAFMFPMFRFLRLMGMRHLQLQVLMASYPWFGAQVQMLSQTGRSIRPLINSHLVYVFVLYFVYEACQITWAYWLYNKALPAGLRQWLYGLVMLCEYYSIIFLRSRMSIKLVPRFMLVYYVMFHVYLYHIMYGWFSIAMVLLWISTFHIMMRSVRCNEVRAHQLGQVSIEHPRALYSELANPQWQALLPPLWSVFHPLNRADVSIYDGDPDLESGNAPSLPSSTSISPAFPRP